MDRSTAIADVEREVANLLRDRHLPGCSVAVEGSDLQWRCASGNARLRPHRGTTTDTLYAIGSLTKQFTAAAILKLAERQALHLDDDVIHLLTQRRHSSGPTIRQLLSHTSGLSAHLDYLLFTDNNPRIARDSLTDLLFGHPAEAAPGTQWRYSSAGYCLLGLVIEVVTGGSYEDYVTSEVLTPAGLESTTFNPGDGLRTAEGYSAANDDFGSVAYPSSDASFSSGALWSTVGDLIRWETALRRGRVVTPESYALMVRPAMLSDGRTVDYGLGFFLGQCNGHPERSHDGSIGGFSAQLAHYPDDHLTVAVLVNSEAHEAERVEKLVTRRLLGVEEVPAPARTLSEDELSRYVGLYTFRNQEIPVQLRGNALIVRSPGGSDVRLACKSQNVFVAENDPSQRFEFVINSGHIDGFHVFREGKRLAFSRRVS